MGIIKKLANITKSSPTGEGFGRGRSASALSTLAGGGRAINVIEEYNGYAWKLINIRAKMLSAEDLFIERFAAKKWQQDPLHEFNDVLEGGEGQRDLSELLEATSKSMDMYGEAFWYFSKGETYARPMGVYIMDPTCVTVYVSGEKVTGYIYQKDNENIVMELDEVMHWFDEDPRTPFRGYGPMQAAGWFIKSARYVITYVNNFIENNAIPAGVVVAKGDVDSGDWELFKKQWIERYSGIDNSGKTGFVRGSDLDFIKTGLSLDEMDFEKIKNSTRDDVMFMFGVSKPMAAIFDDINRASATVARQLFAMTFTKPVLKALTRKLTKKVAGWYGKDFRVSSTDPVPEDDDAKLAKFDKGVGRWFTVNEARAAYGEDPLDGQDDIDPTRANYPNGQSSSQTPAPEPQKPKSIGRIVIRTKSNNKADFSYEMKESFRSKTEELQRKYELKFLEIANPILEKQRDAVIAQIDEPKKVMTAKISTDEEVDKMTDALLPIFLSLAQDQGSLSLGFVGNDESTFELTSVMKQYIHDSVSKALKAFTIETQDKVAQTLVDGLQAGDGVNEISKRVSEIYDDVLGVKTPGYRLERLSRTEIIKSSNEITEAAYRQSGVVQKKEWFANPGHCEFCDTLNGSIIPLGSTFVAEGATVDGSDGGTFANSYEDVEHPPIHPQCRCTLIPVIEKD